MDFNGLLNTYDDKDKGKKPQSFHISTVSILTAAQHGEVAAKHERTGSQASFMIKV